MGNPQPIIAEVIGQATGRLQRAGIGSARLDTELLLGRVLGINRTGLYARWSDTLPHETAGAFEALLGRRERREPLQYVTGRQAFWTFDLRVGPGVFVPRPETEHLVEAVLTWGAARGGKLAAGRIADLCTGSGCVALALASEWPQASVYATDQAPEALAVARANAKACGLGGRIAFLEGDLLAPFQPMGLEGRLDVVTANPPYIPSGAIAALQPEVRQWEPIQALDGGSDGLHFYRRIVPEAARYLRRGGLLALEVGAGQAEAVTALIQASGLYSPHTCVPDLAGIPRVVLAERV
ncbi:MAG: peptide chain release factor N(5)-glutamine methyltransferase [Nitrospirae bacterium]|nr:peptide chain release factor N(5)-glutamine methyltransferase [Nitrospirota bacterium]